MKKIRIGIVDDSENLRKTLVKLLHLETDFEVLLSVGNSSDLFEKLCIDQPEVILMDIRMPDKDGVELTKSVTTLYPNIKIIAFTLFAEPRYIINMYRLGVKSFLKKEDDIHELIKAIRVTNSGGTYMPNEVSKIIQQFLNQHSISVVNISDNERKLVKMLMDGLHSKEIGLKLFKSPRTIEDMREKLYLKFNVKNKEQLINVASKWEWDIESNN